MVVELDSEIWILLITMFGAGAFLVWGLLGQKEVHNTPKITKNDTFRAIAFIHPILFNLYPKLKVTNTPAA